MLRILKFVSHIRFILNSSRSIQNRLNPVEVFPALMQITRCCVDLYKTETQMTVLSGQSVKQPVAPCLLAHGLLRRHGAGISTLGSFTKQDYLIKTTKLPWGLTQMPLSHSCGPKIELCEAGYCKVSYWSRGARASRRQSLNLRLFSVWTPKESYSMQN